MMGVDAFGHTRAVADGFKPEGPDVPIGAFKHFVNYANLRANWQHLDPDKPMALLYRREQSVTSLPTGIGIRTATSVSQKRGDNSRGRRHEYSASAAAGGVFLDNVFGWMVHVYPFENDVAKQF